MGRSVGACMGGEGAGVGLHGCESAGEWGVGIGRCRREQVWGYGCGRVVGGREDDRERGGRAAGVHSAGCVAVSGERNGESGGSGCSGGGGRGRRNRGVIGGRQHGDRRQWSMNGYGRGGSNGRGGRVGGRGGSGRVGGRGGHSRGWDDCAVQWDGCEAEPKEKGS